MTLNINHQYPCKKSVSLYLGFDPVLHHFGDGLHDLGIGRLLDQADQDLTNETLPHLKGHHSYSVLDQVQAQNQQLTGHCKQRVSEILIQKKNNRKDGPNICLEPQNLPRVGAHKGSSGKYEQKLCFLTIGKQDLDPLLMLVHQKGLIFFRGDNKIKT